MIQCLLVLHIAVLGYWFGSELVINSTFRYVSYGAGMPFDERTRLMDHVLTVDQHVRYALVLQAGLGFTIAALYGYVPGGEAAAIAVAILAAAWLAFVELVHRFRGRPVGTRLAAADRLIRYGAIVLLVAVSCRLIGARWPTPSWLQLKIGLFAAVIACGVGIRIALMSFFRTWAVMGRDGPSAETNATLRRIYWRATSVLILLWLFIAGIVALSLFKPEIG